MDFARVNHKAITVLKDTYLLTTNKQASLTSALLKRQIENIDGLGINQRNTFNTIVRR